MLLIDAANVVGSRPTGWWRDRAGAARDLVDRLRAADLGDVIGDDIVVVLEGAARPGCAEGTTGRVRVVHAPHEGDETLTAIAASEGPVTLVSADRALGERVRRVGGEVVGPRWLLNRLAP